MAAQSRLTLHWLNTVRKPAPTSCCSPHGSRRDILLGRHMLQIFISYAFGLPSFSAQHIISADSFLQEDKNDYWSTYMTYMFTFCQLYLSFSLRFWEFIWLLCWLYIYLQYKLCCRQAILPDSIFTFRDMLGHLYLPRSAPALLSRRPSHSLPPHFPRRYPAISKMPLATLPSQMARWISLFHFTSQYILPRLLQLLRNSISYCIALFFSW